MDKRLVDYIRQYTSQGYDQNAISQTLLQSGYSPDQINQAFSDAFSQQTSLSDQTTSSRPIHPPWLYLIGALIVISILVFFVSLATNSEPTTKNPLKVDNEFVPAKNNASTTTSGQFQSNDNTESSKNNPQVNTNNDANTLLNPAINQRQPSGSTSSVTTTSTFTSYQVADMLHSLLPDQPEKALRLCDQIGTTAGRYNCYSRIALNTTDETYCRKIDTISSRELCYLQFAAQGIKTMKICDEITNVIRRESCVKTYLIHEQRAEFLESTPQEIEDPQVMYAQMQAQLDAPVSVETIEVVGDEQSPEISDETVSDDESTGNDAVGADIVTQDQPGEIGVDLVPPELGDFVVPDAV